MLSWCPESKSLPWKLVGNGFGKRSQEVRTRQWGTRKVVLTTVCSRSRNFGFAGTSLPRNVQRKPQHPDPAEGSPQWASPQLPSAVSQPFFLPVELGRDRNWTQGEEVLDPELGRREGCSRVGVDAARPGTGRKEGNTFLRPEGELGWGET